MIRYLLPALCALLLFGCEQQPQDKQEPPQETAQLQPLPAVEVQPVKLLQEPLETLLVETAAEAIPSWRKYASVKPTLVLLSQNPFLTPLPEQLKNDALQLVRNGSLADFQAKATPNIPDPVILPQMALSAALEAGFFSHLVWVLPQRNAEAELSLDIFRQQLLESGIASQVEADSFTRNEVGFSGTLRQVTVEVVPHHRLPRITDPVLVHFDLSFFKTLYVNEIKTPLHPLVHQVLSTLRDAQAEALAATISRANREGAVALQVRFLGDLLARLLLDPSQLDVPLAGNDARRGEALYLLNFMQKEKVREIYLAMEETAPQDAAVKYDLYQTARQFKQGGQALDYLAQTVAIDRGYALEYLNLAAVALDKGRPVEALRMLKLAAAAYPQDPFIELRRAKILLQAGHQDQAIASIEQLLKLPWSDVYYQHIPDLLRQELALVRQSPKADHPDATPDKTN